MIVGARGSQRPSSFVFNGNSPQANGLRFWWSYTRGVMLGVLPQHAAQPLVLSGTPTSLTNGLDGVFGTVGQTEFTGAGPANLRVFDSGLPGSLDGLSALTICYWVYPFTVSGSWWGQGTGTSVFLETTGALVGPFWRGASDLRGAFTEVAVTNQWQHLLWVADASNTSYWRNGALAQTVGNGCGTLPAADTAGLYLGGQPSGTGAAQGAISSLWADFRIYNRVLSAPEIWALYDPATRWDLYGVSPRRFTGTPTVLPDLSTYIREPVIAGSFF